jgi:hypothetical protein
MDLRTELRWVVRPSGDFRLDGAVVVQVSERVLQYRQQYRQTQYSQVSPVSGGPITTVEWGAWIDVPEHKEDVK